jgi:hypothetical protein
VNSSFRAVDAVGGAEEAVPIVAELGPRVLARDVVEGA